MKIDWKVAALALLVGMAGCTYPQGETVQVNYYGEMNTSANSFVAEGKLTSSAAPAAQENFSNLQIYLVGGGGEVLHTDELGDLQATYGELNVSLRAEYRPHYVVFHSPDFWDEDVSVEYYELEGGTYVTREATAESELPGFD